tara:strand:+ start:49 stop:594 length:546 start_codon:yes stop_codon:yes gene_type:complete
MNKDIINKIFDLLDQFDKIRLSSVNKQFRNIFILRKEKLEIMRPVKCLETFNSKPFLFLNKKRRKTFDEAYLNTNFLNKIHTLDLSNTDIENGFDFENVHTLNLSYSYVTNVSMLGNVHTLDLSHTNVSDVSMLGNVHTLNLSYTNVKDVSMLGNVHTLDLRNTNVVDISMLGNVQKLILN